MPFKIVRNDITRCERYDAITCGVYGCMMHTAFCNKSHSQEVFDNMKKDLGNTTESAIQATKQALYNLDHPVVYTPKSIEVQQACIKEREFYVAFLEKLEEL